jgi:hypothetical protein
MKSSSSPPAHNPGGPNAEVNRNLRRGRLALAKRIVVAPLSGPGSWISVTTRANGFNSICRKAEGPSATAVTSNPSRRRNLLDQSAFNCITVYD